VRRAPRTAAGSERWRPEQTHPVHLAGHQLEQGLLAFLFHEIREPLKLTTQNQPAM
jgi:hypothetical protein